MAHFLHSQNVADFLQSSNFSNLTVSTGLNGNDHLALRIVFIILMVIASVFGLIGNLLIVGIIALVRDLRTTGNAFLANLAVSDLTLIALVIPFNIVSVVYGADYWDGRMSLCMFIASICAPGCLAAIWSNTGIALNRYIFICHNKNYDLLFAKFRWVLWVACIWLISFGIHLPNHVGWGRNSYVGKYYLCTRETTLWTYSTFFSVVGIILPLCLSFFSYAEIYRLVRKTTSARNQIIKLNRGNAVEPEDRTLNTGERAAINSPVIQIPRWREEVQLVHTLFRSFAVFVVAWLPLAVLLMLPMLEIPAWIYLLAVFLAHGSTASNSINYYLTNAKFRTAFASIFRRMNNRRQLRGDIQKSASTSRASHAIISVA